jgi:nucleotide-binding universal stress UspA family protein
MSGDESDITDHTARSIVVGVDGSSHARSALKWAADEAERRRLPLRVMFAQVREVKNVPVWYAPGSTDLTPGEAVIDDAVGLVATRHPSVMVRGEVVERPPSSVLTVASRSAELLVVGARGKGGFEELLLGSVSDQCIQHAHGPVVVVHADPDDLPLRAVAPRVVVGVDGSLGSTRALSWALEEARLRSASVEAIYAWQYPPVGAFVVAPMHGSEAFAREVVAAATAHAERAAPDVAFSARTAFDAEVPALLDACRGADLLVVGSRGHGRFHDGLLGSIAQQCARHATCAVVVFRPRVSEDGREAAIPSSSQTSMSDGPGPPRASGPTDRQPSSGQALSTTTSTEPGVTLSDQPGSVSPRPR